MPILNLYTIDFIFKIIGADAVLNKNYFIF